MPKPKEPEEPATSQSSRRLTAIVRELGVSTEALSKVRLGTGVVGKVMAASCVISVVTGSVAVASGNPLIQGGGILIIGSMFFTALTMTFRFARENPAAALLEGAEFLVHEQLKMAAKDQRITDEERIPSTDPTQTKIADHVAALLPDSASPDSVRQHAAEKVTRG